MPNTRPTPAADGKRATYGDFDPLPSAFLDGGGGMAVNPWKIGAHEHADGDCQRFLYIHPSVAVDFVLGLLMPPAMFGDVDVISYDVDENDWDVYLLAYPGAAATCTTPEAVRQSSSA